MTTKTTAAATKAPAAPPLRFNAIPRVEPCDTCGAPAAVNFNLSPTGDGSGAGRLCPECFNVRFPGAKPRTKYIGPDANCAKHPGGLRDFLLSDDGLSFGGCSLCLLEAVRKHGVPCSRCGAKLTAEVWVSPDGTPRELLCATCAAPARAKGVRFVRAVDLQALEAETKAEAERVAKESRALLPERLAAAARQAPDLEAATAEVRGMLAEVPGI